MATEGFRAGTHVIAVLEETTAFKTKEADFNADKLKIATWDVSLGFKRQAHDHQAVSHDLGVHPTIVGVKHVESELSFNSYLEGPDAAAGDATAQTPNAFTYLLASALSGAIDSSTGSTTTGTPSTTSVQETDADNHSANTLVGFTVGSEVQVRPVGAYTTDTMTLLMATSTAASGVIYGSNNVQLANTPAFIMQGECIGRASTESFEFFGSVSNFSLPETSGNDPQTISWTSKMATYTDDIGTTQVAPVANRPTVSAGGEFLIAKYGNTATTALKFLNAGLDLGTEYTANPAANDDDNISGWVVTGRDITLTLHVHPDQPMPSGVSAANWKDAWGTPDNDFHVLLNFGNRTAGSIVSFYVPRCHLTMEPEHVDIDGLAALKLTLKPRAGYGDNQIWVAQT